MLVCLSCCSGQSFITSYAVKVPAGQVGVKVYLLGANKGVSNEEVLGVGRYWVGWNEEVYLFPTSTVNYTWTKSPNEGSAVDESFEFQDVEGMGIDADIGISYLIDADKVALIFQKYRKGIDEITNIYLRNTVRDALVTLSSKMTAEDIYGSKKGDLMNAVMAQVRSEVGPIGINVEKIYWIGKMRLPDQIVASLNAKVQANQAAEQAQNKVAQSRAEAAQKVAEAQGSADAILAVAKAQADDNKILAASITPELVRYKAIEKWSGDLPRFTGGGAVPFIDVDKQAAQ